jgi:predicted RecB family nuclease
MPRLITEQSFYQFLKCPNWVYLDAHADAPQPHDPLMALLVDNGLIEEKQRALLARRPDVAEVTYEDPEDAFGQTLAFMHEGRQTIYRGVLLDQHWVGHPDVLEKVEGRSKLGDWYYVAADFKGTREVRDEFMFQGCFYAELLERVQGVKPEQGYVIIPDGTALPYLIAPFEAEFTLTLDEIERIVAGQKPAHFTTSGCKQSPWFGTCRGISDARNDLSLLNRVWRDEVAQLEAAGFHTIDALASASFEDLSHKAPDLRRDRLERMRDQAVCIKKGTHLVTGRVDFPEGKRALYFDIESDPLRDFDYLFGVLSVDGSQSEYRAFFAETPEGQERMWREFVGFIESHFDEPVYHYGSFEADVLRRFIEKYGSSSIAREALERNLIDLNLTLRPAVIFPLTFYSLKDIASYLGFRWRADDASGANSVLWFEKWLGSHDESLKQKILDYNEDDVRATWKLKEWLQEHCR